MKLVGVWRNDVPEEGTPDRERVMRRIVLRLDDVVEAVALADNDLNKRIAIRQYVNCVLRAAAHEAKRKCKTSHIWRLFDEGRADEAGDAIADEIIGLLGEL